MIIISACSDTIINFNNVGIIETSCEKATYDIDVLTDEMWRTIGKYKTEERAKKVLRDIVDNYVACSEYYYMPEE